MYSRIKRMISCATVGAFLLVSLIACEEETVIPWSNAPEVPSYTVELKDEQDGYDRAVLSWLSPSVTAKTVTIEYTVTETEGKPTRFGLAYGKYTVGLGCAQNQGALFNVYSYDDESKFETDFATVGNTYRLCYDIEMGAPVNQVLVKGKDGKVTEHTLTQYIGNTDGVLTEKYEGECTRFGLYYYANTTTDWTAQLEVKCYDDTGKDLGLTYHGLARIAKDVATDGVLTTASKTDSYTAFGSVYNNSVVRQVYDQGLDERYVSYIQADEELTALGANGSVLKILPSNKGDNQSAFSFMFGKKLTKTQVDAGAELVMRVYVDKGGTDFIRYTRFGAPDNKTPESQPLAFNGSNALSMSLLQEASEGFVNIRIDNAFLRAIADENGEVTGIAIYPCSKEQTKFVAYIDEIRYEIPTK